ncbi:helix-turn-helix domain-containing protein [Clostridium intestinale]|uniref:DNA-binding transcriptional regulator, XRE-family HTH domain n=1 Tax=Clostridium intestinale DSM 6191 TaxID=1121320 RepID=A0A1M5TDT0_9CLOT|nr:helix-turn-helix transcriptional regulator [Clostridium intestinale]SHH48780.1 DNA-binding transcriptional regulator, XRE-family HTH domain [Clostridium intestinale DSM 6191]
MFDIRLKELRSEKDILQKDVAKYLNITTSAYGFYEQGKRVPDIEIINKLADFFNVSTDYLLGKSDIKEPAEKILERNKENEYTIALHNNNGYDEELPEEARKEIDNFIEYVRQKYGKKE